MSGTENPVSAHMRRLVERFTEPGADGPSRLAEARAIADAAVDLQQGLRVAGLVLPAGRAATIARAERDHVRVEPHAREILDELRDVATVGLTELGGLNPVTIQQDGQVLVDATGTPIVNQWAAPLSAGHGDSPVVPGFPTGDAEAVIDPDGQIDESDVFTITDVGDTGEHHLAAFVAQLSRQVVDFAGPAGEALIDAIMERLVDRAAEQHIVAALTAAAGAPTDAGANLPAALDTAEGQAGGQLLAPANMLIVHPLDWPTVRRQIAQAYTLAPHPTPVISMGATPGTALVTGRSAFVLQVAPRRYDGSQRSKLSAVRPATLGLEVALMRSWFLAIRRPAAIRAVTL